MILLDTGYFIALFRSEDQLHPRAAAWGLCLNEPLVVTEYILLECVNSLSRPKDGRRLTPSSRTFDLTRAVSWFWLPPIYLSPGYVCIANDLIESGL